MTPAEKLRIAAAKVRTMATPASRGPWHVGDCELYPRWILSDGETDQHGYAADVIRISEEWADEQSVSDADWQWMAFAHPGLAEPLAFLLEEAAKQADMNVTRAPRHRVDVAAALAVARAINGSGS